MKRILKWVALVVVVLAACGFVAFLYFIPPLMSMAPEEFINGEAAMAPPVDGIADPAVRAIAERGRYVLHDDRLHAAATSTPGPQGPMPDMYLAGGRTFVTNTHGTVVSRNLTPDKETGLAQPHRRGREARAPERRLSRTAGRSRTPRCRGRSSPTGATRTFTPSWSTCATSSRCATRFRRRRPGARRRSCRTPSRSSTGRRRQEVDRHVGRFDPGRDPGQYASTRADGCPGTAVDPRPGLQRVAHRRGGDRPPDDRRSARAPGDHRGERRVERRHAGGARRRYPATGDAVRIVHVERERGQGRGHPSRPAARARHDHRDPGRRPRTRSRRSWPPWSRRSSPASTRSSTARGSSRAGRTRRG